MDDSFIISDENLAKASIEELMFIFSESEKQLKESIESGQDVLTRSTILLTVSLAVSTSIVGVLFTSHKVNHLNITLLIVLVYNLIAIYKIQKNLRGQDYFTIGAQPKDLLHNWYFDTFSDANKRQSEIVITQINSHQERLISNNNLNRIRWNEFRESITMLVLLPVIAPLLYAIIYLF